MRRNPYRLYHVVGNVREWVQDGWQDGYAGAPSDGSAKAAAEDGRRVVRGGAYPDEAGSVRSATRSPLAATTRDAITGFRLVRELPD